MNHPYIVYHVAAMGHWREVVDEQLALLKQVGLAGPDLPPPHVTFVGSDVDYEWLVATFARCSIPFTPGRRDTNVMHYETFAMLYIEQWARQAPDDAALLYLHTKGVSNPPGHPEHDGKTRWRWLMQDALVRDWRKHFDALAGGYDAIGVNWTDCHVPHFSGNFWMATAWHLRQLPDFVGFHGSRQHERTNCEFWIGQRRPRMLSLVTRNANFVAQHFPAMDVRFSCLIPTINRPTLAATLASLRQLRPQDELILINNSTGDLAPVVTAAGLACKVVVFHEPEKIQCAGHVWRNKYMIRSTGNYLIFQDDDDVYVDGAIERMRAECSRHFGKLMVFRMNQFNSHDRTRYILPERDVMEVGQISTQMAAVPNDPPRWGQWAERRCGDFDFFAGCRFAHHWSDTLIVKIRPHEMP